MTSSTLLSQAKKNNRLFIFRAWFYVPVLLLLLFFGWKSFFQVDDNSADLNANIEIYTVEKGDISTSIESDGNINHADTIDLTFGISGKIENVYIEEGDNVEMGDVLATLETKELEFSKEKAKISVNIARANLNQALAGSTNEDIRIAEKNIRTAELDLQNTKEQNQLAIENARIAMEEAEKNLELVQKDQQNTNSNQVLDTQSAQTNLEIAEENLDIAIENQEKNALDMQNRLDQTYEDAQQSFSLSRVAVDNTLQEAEKIIDPENNENYGVDFLFSAKDKGIKTQSEDLYTQITNEYEQELQDLILEFTAENKTEIYEEFTNRITFLEKNKLLLQKINIGLDNSVAEPEVLRPLKTSVLNQETSLTNEITKLTSAKQAIDSAEIAFEKQVLADKNSITRAMQSLEEAEQNISKLSGNQDTTEVQQETSLLTAEKNYQKSKLSYENAIEKLKISESLGENNIAIANERFKSAARGPRSSDTAALYQQIENAEVALAQAIYNLSEAQILAPVSGTIIKRDVDAGEIARSDSSTPAFVLLGESNFELKTFIEEADIARIFIGQDIDITFDALEDQVLTGKVNFISQTATTDANGVVTYEVTAQIYNPNNAGIREGMTAYSKFIISKATDTLLIPLKAVNENMVELENGTQKKVSLGITNGKIVEIVSGLEEGEKLVIGK